MVQSDYISNMQYQLMKIENITRHHVDIISLTGLFFFCKRELRIFKDVNNLHRQKCNLCYLLLLLLSLYT